MKVYDLAKLKHRGPAPLKYLYRNLQQVGKRCHTPPGQTKEAKRREYFKLCVCRRILQGEFELIQPDVFEPGTPISARHSNSQPLFRPHVRADHRYSYFHTSVIPLWNKLPENIVSCQSTKGFN